MRKRKGIEKDVELAKRKTLGSEGRELRSYICNKAKKL